MEELLEQTFSIRTFFGVLFTSLSSFDLFIFSPKLQSTSRTLFAPSPSTIHSPPHHDDNTIIRYCTASARHPVDFLGQLLHLLSLWLGQQTDYSTAIVAACDATARTQPLTSRSDRVLLDLGVPSPTTELCLLLRPGPLPSHRLWFDIPRSLVSLRPTPTFLFPFLAHPALRPPLGLSHNRFVSLSPCPQLPSITSLLFPSFDARPRGCQAVVNTAEVRIENRNMHNNKSDLWHEHMDESWKLVVSVQWQKAEKFSQRALLAEYSSLAPRGASGVLGRWNVRALRVHPPLDAALLGPLTAAAFPALTSWMTYSNDIALRKEIWTFYKRSLRSSFPKPSSSLSLAFSPDYIEEDLSSKQSIVDIEKSTLAESAAAESSEEGDSCDRALDFGVSSFEEEEDFVEVAEEVPWCSMFCCDINLVCPQAESLPGSYFSRQSSPTATPPAAASSSSNGAVARGGGRLMKAAEAVRHVLVHGLCRSNLI
eukprot:GHVS01045361.1.p1 GENE.GHVS01045361.1~~GHVS01045361.1.p1  ORF type:complete len:482 (-),score=66.49 GHVS01045361.1:330-1775(-)